MFTMFSGWCSSIVISMLMKSNCGSSKGAVAMMGCIGVWYKCLHIGCIVHSCWSLCASSWPCQATRTGPAAGTTFTADPVSSIWVTSIHSSHSMSPWGLQTTKLLPVHQPVCRGNRGLLDRVSAFSTLKGQPLPPQYPSCLPRDASNSVLFNWRSNWSWPYILDLPIKQPPNQPHVGSHTYEQL